MTERVDKKAFSMEGSMGANHKSAPPPADFTKQEELDAYRKMLLIRRFEEKVAQLYGAGEINGFCHVYIGQEAVIVGAKKGTKAGDQFITSYRCHAHALMSGFEPRAIMAELTGRRDGVSHGKGGSMHMFSLEKNFFGGHGIVGAQVPLGAGLAFANQYRGNDSVALAFFGDGASNQGQVFESFNMAGLWKLPIIFVLENNRYGMGTAVARASAETDFSRRGAPFKIPSMVVDGMDVRAVTSAVEEAADWARSGKGPVLLDVETYRYRGHSVSDPAKYRPKEELEEVRRNNDAIDHVKKRLMNKGWADESGLKEIEKEVREIVADAVDFAEKDPQPANEQLYTDILA